MAFRIAAQQPQVAASKRTCSVPRCQNPCRTRGWCNAHYQRWLRYGSPTAGRTPKGAPIEWMKNVALNYNSDDCLKWPFRTSSDGRGLVFYKKDRAAANAVCEMVHGPPPTSAHEAAHSCGNGHLGCVNPKHLRWATHRENMEDSLVHGTRCKGTDIGTSKLKEGDVVKIRQLAETTLQKDLAKKYNVCEATISQIVNRKLWGWL